MGVLFHSSRTVLQDLRIWCFESFVAFAYFFLLVQSIAMVQIHVG
jgi:hypothetical protein